MANSFYKPIINIPDTTSGFDVFGTKGLFDDINNTNQQINSMNLPQPKPKNPYRQQNIGNMLLAFSDVVKGRDPSAGVMQRKTMLDAQKKEAERKADIETFLKNNPQFRQAYELKNMLGIDMPSAKDNNPNSYKEYALTDNTPTQEEYATFLDRNQKPKSIPERQYEKAGDGFFRYIDDGTKVFGDVEIPDKTFEIKTTDILSTQKEEKKTFDATNKGVKNFQQLLDAAEAADGAASYALMIKFIKQLDDSVVREGEVNTFGGFQGALTNLKNQISKTSGEGFTSTVKANMINLAAQTAERLVSDYNLYKQGKETSYAAIGFDPSMIFAGLDFNLGDLDLTKVYTPSDFEIIEFE